MRARYLAALAAIGLACVFVAAAGAGRTSRTADPTTALAVRAFQTTPGAAADTEIEVFAPASVPIAAVTIYVPAGYRITLPGANAKVGDAAVQFRSSGGSNQAGAVVTADDPARHTADACAPGTHAGVWLLSATVGGRGLVIPIYVDPATADVAPKAAYSLKLCLDAATAAGFVFEEVDIDLPQVLTNPSTATAYVWRALLTPYGAGEVPDAARTVEAQSLVPLPHRLTLGARYDAKKHTVTLSGVTTIAGGIPAAGFDVGIASSTSSKFSSVKLFANAKTDKRGRYTVTKPLRQTTYFFSFISFYLIAQCDPTLGSAPCVSETLAPPSGAIAVAKVKK